MKGPILGLGKTRKVGDSHGLAHSPDFVLTLSKSQRVERDLPFTCRLVAEEFFLSQWRTFHDLSGSPDCMLYYWSRLLAVRWTC